MTAYLQPTSTTLLPGKLSLTQFIQTVIVGVSGIPGPLVRPEWQVEPPKQPDLTTNWIAMGVATLSPDANAYIQGDTDTASYQRHEAIEVTLSIFGPDAIDTYGLIRDGFQVPQNRYALNAANMGFVEIIPGRRLPELVNERWIDRIVTSIFLRREIQRVYGIPSILSAAGVIHTVIGNEEYLLDWNTENVET